MIFQGTNKSKCTGSRENVSFVSCKTSILIHERSFHAYSIYFINSLVINTTKAYENFKYGIIGFEYDTVIIEKMEHPSLLLDAKELSNKPQSMIKIEDTNGNRVTLEPKTRTVRAAYRTGANMLSGIPLDYDVYYVAFYDKAEVTDADLDAILQWKNAIRLTITDNSNVAYRLSQRLDELKQLEHLENISLDVPAKFYTKLSTKPFLEGLKSLNLLGFYGPNVERNQFIAFLANQEPVEGWKAEPIFGRFEKWVWFTRNGVDVWFE